MRKRPPGRMSGSDRRRRNGTVGMTEQTYRIGEAARLLDLEGYVLRYWETEFAQLRPGRTPKGQRLYSEADLDRKSVV